MKRSLSISTFALSLVLGVTGVHAQSWTNAYTSATATGTCTGLPAALNTGFTTTPVVSQALFASVAPVRILKMAFWKQPSAQYNDIYMIEKGISSGTTARVLYYNGATSALSVMGTIPNVNFGGGGVQEDGGIGIAVNPVTHGTDNYIYIDYSVGVSATYKMLTLDASFVGTDIGRGRITNNICGGACGNYFFRPAKPVGVVSLTAAF